MNRFYIVKEYIDYYLYKNNLSKNEFCRLCQIDKNTLWKIYNKQKEVYLKDLVLISLKIEVPLSLLMLDLADAKHMEKVINFYYKNNRKEK